MFNVFTDVPLPGRFFGLNNDDLTFSTDPKSLLFGEKSGIPFSPVGIYDFANRLITTVETDYNGIFDVLLPSTNRISCPTPSGVCGNLYRFVGNDPGIPGRLNLNYNPHYRTIAADFETWPGIIVPADTAPTQVGVSVPAARRARRRSGSRARSTTRRPRRRPGPRAVLDLAAVRDRHRLRRRASRSAGPASARSGQLTLDGVALATSGWSDTPDHGGLGAERQLRPAPAAGHGRQRPARPSTGSPSTGWAARLQRLQPAAVRGRPDQQPELLRGQGHRRAAGSRRPRRCPRRPTTPIQNALNAAPPARWSWSTRTCPSANPRQNPRGAYYENLIISKRVKLQGVGPGSPNPAPGRCRPRLDHRRRRLRRRQPRGDRLVRPDRRPDLGRQPGHQRRRGDLALPAEQRRQRLPDRLQRRTPPRPSTASTSGAATSRASPATSPRSAACRPAGRAALITQGGAIFANALRPQPPDHQQHRPEQRRRLRDDPHRHPGPAGARHGQPERRRPDHRTTGSSTTPAPTWRAASASSPAPTATSSATTTSAATSRPSTAAA